MQPRDGWSNLQRRYYEERPHDYLHPEQGGRYAERIAAKLWDRLSLPRQSHGLEIGCGAGRFSLPLLGHCDSLEVADLSARQLALLGRTLDARGIDRSRCTPHEADVERLDEILPHGRYDFVVGVFILHHLEDPGDTLRRLLRLLRPGGRAVFLEPNRWNPLFVAQIALTPDMSFREERRLYQLGSHRLLRLMQGAGFDDARVDRAGCFPPFVVNRFAGAARVEDALEGVRWLRLALPFLMISGTRAEGAAP